MKTIERLIESVDAVTVCGANRQPISALTCDSREVAPGSCFLAVRGTAADGHRFIPQAIAAGAAAVVCQALPETLAEGVCYVVVDDTHAAMADLAAAFYDYPARELQLVGVTGTNGKTTVATLLYDLFRALGYEAGLISTVVYRVGGRRIESTHTTPDAIRLNALLREMADAGCSYCFMEVSSHAIVQDRIRGLRFAGGIFTNITHDHLDYHKTFAAYIQAKKRFFDQLPADAFALTNIDDKAGAVMLQNTRARKYTYSLRTLADFKARIVESRIDGTTVAFDGRDVETRFTGRFNVYNMLAVYAATCLLGRDKEQVLVNMSLLVPVAGRFQTLHSVRGYSAIIDYAHTPDALANVLTTIHDVLAGKGRIITVVGAGGNRDKGKRPMMAKEAVRWSDELILTSDNPRFEDPDDIINDMMAGLGSDDMAHTLAIADRRQAIRAATRMAQAGDVILIAGKGHEDYQEIKGVKHHFDDKEEVEKIFADEQNSATRK